jgi:tetratricopeptide (TPR) repeat protein
MQEAAESYQQALEIEPLRAATHYNLANALSRLGRTDEALDAYERALELRPEYPRALNNLGSTLHRLGRLEEAIRAYRKALALEPDEADVCNNLANALKDTGSPEEALALYDRAIGLGRAGRDRLLANKALLLMQMGDTAGSKEASRAALALNPDSVPAWHIQSVLKTFAREDPDLPILERLLARADALGMPLEERIRLLMTLGKAWLDAGDPERAFAHLEEGNRLKRATIHYDARLTGERITAVGDTFTRELLQRLSDPKAGDPSEAPVFVLGMPRSGTSLVEQILASHPDVHGAGELPILRQLVPGISEREPESCPPRYPEILARYSAADLTRLGVEYVGRVCDPYPHKKRVVDKMPVNFLYAGLIHLILPNARIIHCRRDPVDTCLSCYLRTFSGDVGFSYDLSELGDYYRHYLALMDHWRALLPAERFLEVCYEDIVEDLEGQARRMVEFCGLPWDAACLSFHRTDRLVRTASATEVRQPIYRSSVGRWRPYGRYLAPLLSALAG